MKLEFAAGLSLLLLAGAAQAQAPLVLETRIPLPGVRGRIDHMAVDPGRNRLFVAELGNGTVEAIDLAAGKSLRRLAGFKRPQGVGYAAKPDLVVVATGGDGAVNLLTGADLTAAGIVGLDADADDVWIDGTGGEALVGHGHGGLAVIDPAQLQKSADIPLAAHPEGFALGRGGRVFVNVPDAAQIAVLDLAGRRQVATWTPRGLHANFPLAVSGDGSLLATVFRQPPRLALLDAATGAVAASLETCRDADDVFFDDRRRRIYVSCGEGTIEAFAGEAAGWRALGRVATAPGARTSLFPAARDRLYVAAPAGAGHAAAILVFRPVP